MRLWRKKRTAARSPYPEPGIYKCKSARCDYVFVHFGRDQWRGPLFPVALPIVRLGEPAATIYVGDSLTWEQLDELYADCAARLERAPA